ncbi:MAG: RCC1 domain-containing protein [Nannocystaceae bacterium]|nr:hypothetical protein [bacterium]
MRSVLLLALVALPGCIEVAAFACRPGTCDLDGRAGTCEPEGWCSYPDDACDSGRRFESRAPGALGGACVEPAVATTGSTGGGTTRMTDPTLSPTSSSTTSGRSEVSGSTSTNPPCDGHGCGWTKVESGPLHTCALDGNGAPWCWGVGASGELGIGSNATFRDCPAAPAGELVDQDLLSVGGHTCALGPEGLHCWGSNGARQVDWTMGQNQFLEPHPVDLSEYGTPTSLGVGIGATCVGIGNQLLCWGGGATEVDILDIPAPVVSVKVGDDHTCGLLDDDSLWCLGSDAQGQLGGGNGDQSNVPVSPDLNGQAALLLDVGARHTCAITDGDGPDARDVKCWGDNRALQAGGVVENQIDAPRDVSGNLVSGAWLDVAAGEVHSCAINEAGEVWCWGTNTYGQVDPHAEDFEQQLTAARIDLEPAIDAVDIAVATTITCALDRDARWWCWGCLEPWMVSESGECTVSPPTLFEPC